MGIIFRNETWTMKEPEMNNEHLFEESDNRWNEYDDTYEEYDDYADEPIFEKTNKRKGVQKVRW